MQKKCRARALLSPFTYPKCPNAAGAEPLPYSAIYHRNECDTPLFHFNPHSLRGE